MSSSPDYDHDLEKKAAHTAQVTVDEATFSGPAGQGGAHMHRSLKPRQVSMIAIAGTLVRFFFMPR